MDEVFVVVIATEVVHLTIWCVGALFVEHDEFGSAPGLAWSAEVPPHPIIPFVNSAPDEVTPSVL